MLLALSGGWLTIRPVSSGAAFPILQSLLMDLNDGEAEAMVLALELNPGWLLLDEDEARRKATHHGLPVTGTLGILLRAKASGFIPLVAPLLAELKKQGFWISDEVYNEVLRQAGEA